MAKLDAEERKILAAYERGEYRPVTNGAKMKAKLIRLAREHHKKQERMNIRVSRWVMDGVRRLAASAGLPYQTFVSSVLHKLVAGRYTEKAVR